MPSIVKGVITSMYWNCNTYGYIFPIRDTHQTHPCWGVLWCRSAPLISALLCNFDTGIWILAKPFCFVVGFSKAIAQTIRWMHRPSCIGAFLLCPLAPHRLTWQMWCCSRVFTVVSCFCSSVLFLSPRFLLLLLLPSAPLLYFQHLIVFWPGAAKEKLT